MRNYFINNTALNGTAFSDYTSLPSGYFNYAPDVFTGIVFNSVAG
jgi:hypothetical protein